MEVTIGMTDNSKEQVRYRRAQNLLIIVGKGMLMLALWNGIKTAGILILRKNQGCPVNVSGLVKSPSGVNLLASRYLEKVSLRILPLSTAWAI